MAVKDSSVKFRCLVVSLNPIHFYKTCTRNRSLLILEYTDEEVGQFQRHTVVQVWIAVGINSWLGWLFSVHCQLHKFDNEMY